MNSQRPLILLGVTLVILITLPSFALGIETRRVLFVGPLSGAAASFGESAATGVRLALAAKPDGLLEVIFEDDQLSAERAVRILRRQTSSAEIEAVIAIGASTANALAAICEQERLPLLAASSDVATAKHRSFVLRTWPSGQQEGRQLAHALVHENVTTCAVFVSPNDYHLAIADGLRTAQNSLNECLEVEVSPSMSDFRALLARLRHKQLQGFVLLLHPGQSALLATQARALGMRAQFFGGIQFESINERTLSQEALVGAYYVTREIPPHILHSSAGPEIKRSAVPSLAALHFQITEALLSIPLSRSGDVFFADLTARLGIKEEHAERFLPSRVVLRRITQESKNLVSS